MSSSRQSLRSKPLRGGGTCPICGAKRVVLSTEDIVLRVRGRRYQLDSVPHERCAACGERIFGLEVARQFDALILGRKRYQAA
jgi:YgiT-type zinc finger domain-containing protein